MLLPGKLGDTVVDRINIKLASERERQRKANKDKVRPTHNLRSRQCEPKLHVPWDEVSEEGFQEAKEELTSKYKYGLL